MQLDLKKAGRVSPGPQGESASVRISAERRWVPGRGGVWGEVHLGLSPPRSLSGAIVFGSEQGESPAAAWFPQQARPQQQESADILVVGGAPFPHPGRPAEWRAVTRCQPRGLGLYFHQLSLPSLPPPRFHRSTSSQRE